MTTKTQLDLEVLLPDVHEEGDACLQRLRDQISTRTGVEKVHLIERVQGDPLRLCVHVDSSEFSVQELRQFANRAGARLQAKYGHLLLNIAALPASRARRLGNQC